jgi:hypothetical protein
LRQLAHHASTKRPAAARSIICLPMRAHSPHELSGGMTWRDLHVNNIDLIAVNCCRR